MNWLTTLSAFINRFFVFNFSWDIGDVRDGMFAPQTGRTTESFDDNFNG